MPPSDEELEAITGLDNLQLAARMDMNILQSWIEVGFTREEAMAMLIALKRSRVDVIIVQEEKED